MAKWNINLSTTDENHIGLVKVRMDNTSEVFRATITENGKPYDFKANGINKVYFNTKFQRFGTVQEEATIIDATNGIIEYTLTDNDMQQATDTHHNHIQLAYFEFRKDDAYVASTQTFGYHIMSSIYNECTDGQSYIVKLEELFSLYQRFMNQQSQDWEDYFNANKEIIESVDPGGKVLSELIAATGDYKNLKERLDYIDKGIKNNQIYQRSKKPQVVFTCDDGAYQDYVKLLPIIKEKDVKFSLAIISDWVGSNEMNTDFMTWDQIREFTDLGCELMSHSTQQQHLTQLSDESLDYALKHSKEVIESHGFSCNFLAYPYGENDIRVRTAVRKYYRGALGIKGINKFYGANHSDLWSYNVARVALGSSFDPAQTGFPQDTSSLDYYKARVDNAIQNKSMLVFMVHTATNDFNEEQQQHLKDLIDYLRQKGIEPTTVTDAFNQSGNIIETGDQSTNFFKIDADGVVTSNNNQFVNNVTISSIDEYGFDLNSLQIPSGVVVSPISTTKANTDTLSPTTIGGTLITFNLNKVSFDFVRQTFIDIKGNRFERRISNIEKLNWSSWEVPIQKINISVDSTASTVKAVGQYQITHKHVSFKNTTVHSVYPKTNLPHGFIYSSYIINGELIIRIMNINSTDQTLPANTWYINFMN